MFEEALDGLRAFLPTLATLVLVGLGLAVARVLFALRAGKDPRVARLPRQVTMLLLTGVGIVAVVISLPVSDATQGDLLSLVGLAVSALLTLSSTTFVSNAMAGLMLRSTHEFRPGDFLRVGDTFGRVTERGLFHVQVQTEDRDLSTIPNLLMVTKPVTTILASGTIVSTSLTLGYDVDRRRVEGLLKDAAEAAELEEPFVYVMALGDFAVTYRVAGFLRDVKQLLTVRSRLRKRVLDRLHDAGIEIASPTLMAQRRLGEGHEILPPSATHHGPEEEHTPETVIFDKAEQAREREDMAKEREAIGPRLEALEEAIVTAEGSARTGLEHQRDALLRRRDAIDTLLAQPQDG